jgi:hypothetical protein
VGPEVQKSLTFEGCACLAMSIPGGMLTVEQLVTPGTYKRLR